MDVHLMGRYLMGRHLMAVYLMGRYLIGILYLNLLFTIKYDYDPVAHLLYAHDAELGNR